MKQSKNEINLGEGSVGRLLLTLAVPSVIAQLVNLLYNLVDRIYIGHIPENGGVALTGLGLCFPILMIVTAFSGLIGYGGAPRVAIFMGKGKNDEAEEILGNCTMALIVIALILVVVLQFAAEPLLMLFGASDNTLPYALSYLNIYGKGTLFVMLTMGLNSFINAQGRPAIAMYSVLIGALLNIVLDPIFIFWLDMGVKGAALATVLSQACSAVWVLTFLFSRHASLPLEKRYMALNRKIILSIFALGVSPFIMASTESLVGFVLNSSLKDFGDIYVSALTILQSAMQFASVPLTGFAQGFVPIVSYNYGHGDKQRVKDCFRVALITMFSFNLLLMLFMILFPSTVASAFTSDERLIETVRWTMPVFLGGMTIFGLQRACQNMFVALGQAKISIFIALLRKVILLIPLALILPHLMGVAGVYAAEAISDATAAICCTLLFFWQFPKILGKIQRSALRIS